MTREEAIKRLEWLEMVAEHVDSVTIGSKCTEDWEAYNMAIAALREQVNVVDFDQFNGCKYCTNEENDIPLPTDVSYTWISGNKLQNAYGECKIKFCPMCGRRLEEV